MVNKNNQVRKLYKFKPLTRQFLANPSGYMENLTPAARIILDCILNYSNSCHYIFPSQTTLANAAGVRRETANRIIRLLQDMGLVSTQYRHMYTSLYAVAPIFKDLEIRQQLSRLLPSLKYLPMMILMVANIYGFEESPKGLLNRFMFSNITQKKCNIYTKEFFYPQYTDRSRVRGGTLPSTELRTPKNMQATVRALKKAPGNWDESTLSIQDRYLFEALGHLATRQNYNEALEQYWQQFTVSDNFIVPPLPFLTVQPSERSVVMKHYEPTAVLATISQDLNLALAGQIRLSAFPDSVLQHVYSGLRFSKHVRDKFALFMKLALDYCRANDIRPNWQLVDTLKAEYEVTADSPVVNVFVKPSTVTKNDSWSGYKDTTFTPSPSLQEHLSTMNTQELYANFEKGKQYLREAGIDEQTIADLRNPYEQVPQPVAQSNQWEKFPPSVGKYESAPLFAQEKVTQPASHLELETLEFIGSVLETCQVNKDKPLHPCHEQLKQLNLLYPSLAIF